MLSRLSRAVPCTRSMMAAAQKRNFKAAVVLHGNGVYDGTETTEAVSLLVSLSKHKANVQCFAPDRAQMHVVNHMTGDEQKEERNVLLESARIARGNVKSLDELKSSDFDALFIPGGFGAAKNLSDFGVKGADMSVKPDVEAVLKDFHSAQKQIGLCCISPVIAAKVFGRSSSGPGLKMTLGSKGDDWPYNGSIDAAKSFGNELVDCDIDGIVHDEVNKVVTAPAYMKGTASPSQIYDNVKAMVDKVASEIRADQVDEAPVVAVIHVTVKAEALDAFKVAIGQNAKGSRLEPGCYRFDVTQDQEDPTKFVFYEAYKNADAVAAHRASPHFHAWNEFKESGAVTHFDRKLFNGVNYTF